MKKVVPVLWALTLAAACQDAAPPVTAPVPSKPAYAIPVPDDPCTESGVCSSQSQDGISLAPQFTLEYCFGGLPALNGTTDRDADGISDDCEYQVAKWFRPLLARNNTDEEPRRESYWAVRRKPGTYGTVQVFYALGYYRDKGAVDGGYGSHPGDSEFILLDITNYQWYQDPALWQLDRATMSAHWGVSGFFEQDHTGSYAFPDLEYLSTYRGRPRIWVSKNKHANYRSKDTCNYSGFLDHCDSLREGTTYEDVEVLASANLGSSWQPMINCVYSRNGFYNNGWWQECLWSTTMAFAGWTGDRNGASTPYGVMLTHYNF